MSSTSSILGLFSSSLFSMLLAKRISTPPFRQLPSLLLFSTTSRDSTKLPMFMYSVENQCPSRELSSTVSTIGFSLVFSMQLNYISSLPATHTVLQLLLDFVEPGLSLNFSTTNVTKYWVISDEVPNKNQKLNMKTLQNPDKFPMASGSIKSHAPTTSGRP